MGVNCILVAPERSKTNHKIKTEKRRDQIARLMRSGELESIHVPSEEDEAVRDYLIP
ncbi:hypothetical protein LEP1GSC016_2916 [Leptospira borgpetersenii serovar Hardjo-bovis str. Sponselee]|uniref:Transposase domain protein n=1 Tax=Leptospira borgpetersenii serovar Hardjo-bovis str. Sponselee TaxID=1303729 RepID=M6BEJ0_LEPBO|nr:hypothetical protein LEP1GSC016_2916 [Leptospira borgpetersenii serovar Hardjo-bovis str. Sponselee]